MISTPAPSAAPAGPRWRRWSLSLTGLAALSAVGGGAALVLARTGSSSLPPVEVLEYTPFQTFLVPGLLLSLVIGGTNLAATVLIHRRSPYAVDATLLAGGSLSLWIAAEVAMMRGLHWLHGLYGALGLTIACLGLVAARRGHEPRHRWVVRVTLGEALGYAAPICVGLWSANAQHDGLLQWATFAAAGAVEGALLGLGQAHAWPLPLDRRRYVALTAAAAALVWASFMGLPLLAGADTAPSAWLLGLGTCVALLGLLAIGFAQWLELRRHVARAHRWIAWTALAWLVALPWSFAAGPFVDERTPLAVHLTLWGAAGLLMAYAMALVTWQGARRLLAGGETPRSRAQHERLVSASLAAVMRCAPASANDNAPELSRQGGRDPWNHA